MKFSTPTRDGVGTSFVNCPSGPWSSVFDFLCERFPHISKEQWSSRFAQGDVLDATYQALDLAAPYRPLRKVFYFRELAFEPHIPFEETILYQDEHLVVADKPHFLPVTPSGRYLQETLLIRLKKRLGLRELSPIHRLDRETAGVVAFCVQAQERPAYHQLFLNRRVIKRYQAIAPINNHLDFPVRRESRLQESAQPMQMAEVDGPINAITSISLQACCDGVGLFELSPITGAKHQLRVHMLALGMPIRGDRIYPQHISQVQSQPENYTDPLQLLAKELSFVDPMTQQARQFTSERLLAWPPPRS